MPGLSPFLTKRVLDFLGGGQAAPAPSQRWLGLVDPNGSELSPAGYSRVSCLFAPASSPIASVSMTNTAMFGTFTGPATAQAFVIWDASSGGNVLVSSSFATALAQPNGGFCVYNVGIDIS